MATTKTTSNKKTKQRTAATETSTTKAPRATTAARGAKGKQRAAVAAANAKGATRATRARHGADGAKDKPRSGILEAAAQILAKAKEPMGCKDIVEQAVGNGLWSPGGKTPQATLYAAIIREIAKKGKDARFKKVDRGRFQLAR